MHVAQPTRQQACQLQTSTLVHTCIYIYMHTYNRNLIGNLCACSNPSQFHSDILKGQHRKP